MDRTRLSVNCSIIFTELPLLDRPRAAAAAGFSAVEFWWPFVDARPQTRELDDFVHAIDDAGVSLGGLNFFAGDMSAGERGILSSPTRARDFVDNVEVIQHLAEATGCRVFNALYGNRLADEIARGARRRGSRAPGRARVVHRCHGRVRRASNHSARWLPTHFLGPPTQ